MEKAFDLREFRIVRIGKKEIQYGSSYELSFIHQSNEEYKLQFLHSRRRLYYYSLLHLIGRRILNNIFCSEQWSW